MALLCSYFWSHISPVETTICHKQGNTCFHPTFYLVCPGKWANCLTHHCEALLRVYVIAPVLLTTGTDSGTPELEVVCSPSCHVALGPQAETKIFPESTVGHRKVLNEGYESLGAGTGQGWESAPGDVWQYNLCSSLHPKFSSCSFRLCCLEEVFQKFWQDKSSGVHHRIYYYTAAALHFK